VNPSEPVKGAGKAVPGNPANLGFSETSNTYEFDNQLRIALWKSVYRFRERVTENPENPGKKHTKPTGSVRREMLRGNPG
jgi:hypothetical protein